MHLSDFIAWFGNGRPPGEILYWVSQITLAIIAMTAAMIAYRQVKAFGALELVKFMQGDGIRRARHHLRSELAGKPYADWSERDKFEASTVCSSFDLMGFLIRNKLSPRRQYIRLYAIPIQRSHAALGEYLAEQRDPSRNGPDFWRDFDWLHEEARRINPHPAPADRR